MARLWENKEPHVIEYSGSNGWPDSKCVEIYMALRQGNLEHLYEASLPPRSKQFDLERQPESGSNQLKADRGGKSANILYHRKEGRYVF